MRYISGTGGGYTAIPENEAVDGCPESNRTTPVQPLHNSSRINGTNESAERWDNSGLEDVSPPPAASRKRKIVLLCIAVVAVVIMSVGIRGIIVHSLKMKNSPDGGREVKKKQKHGATDDGTWYMRESGQDGRFMVEDYDVKPPFSDFLPGVAGLYGKPLWSFYVNRGQAITAFGSKSKDYPLLEFYSANKAYQNTAFLGFRTFLVGQRGERSFLAEPFAPSMSRFEGVSDDLSQLPKRHMYVGANDVSIQELDLKNNMETTVSYFTLPEENFESFVRRTTITNTDGVEKLRLSILDGLARVEPVGGPLNEYLKNMGRTLEGWFGVLHADDENRTMPYYKMSTVPNDSAAVEVVDAGHYCLSFIENYNSVLLPIVYDTSKVFGEDTSLLRPVGLMASTVKEILSGEQYGSAKTSSAFAAVDEITLLPGESITISSFYGETGHIMDVPVIARKIIQSGFVQYKFSRAEEIINQLTVGAETKTKNDLFNGHVKQMFLDNGLRGGFPMILGDVDDRSSLSNADQDKRLKVFHVFSRVHGDLERDYNDFIIDTTYFSQGPGNFRDVAQNRRSDVVFNPRIGSFDVKVFLSYIQADGYNPFVVEAVVFTIDDKDVCDNLATVAVGAAVGHRAQRDALADILCNGPFRPGQLFLLMEEQHINLIIDRQRFIDEVAAAATYTPMGVYSDGYWADHWTYYLDLIESYVSIYPEGEEELMYDEKLKYFFSPATVLPRKEKYVLSKSFDGKGSHVRQLNATVFDKEKQSVQMNYVVASTGWYGISANWQHEQSGRPFQSSPIAKLFLLATLKFATRDAYGMGIEYEGGKPGWNDAMNGLVGMVGSGMPETYELQLLLRYILSLTLKYRRPILVPRELKILFDEIEIALKTLNESGYIDAESLKTAVPKQLFEYWDSVASARETYRSEVRLQFSGETEWIYDDTLVTILDRWLLEIELGTKRALKVGSHGFGNNGSYVSPTYFSYNITEWMETGSRNKKGHPLVVAKSMSVCTFALFLEGPTRKMKTVGEDEALQIYQDVKRSGLRDEQLKMYTISASLVGQSMDMGRMMAFSPGWLENQSVWTHMSYKYYLELLRNRLYDQFYDEMLSGGMLPFMDPEVYGRSLMECSSFLASSAFDDPVQRGRGFLARLSGATAEFLSIWILMFIGPNPFFLDEETGVLSMQLKPALPLWLFENDVIKAGSDGDDHTISFKLFATINVKYHNSQRRDLFDVLPERYHITHKDGSTISVVGPIIKGNVAKRVRGQLLVDSIDVYF